MPYTDLLSLLHGLSILSFPEIPLLETNTFAFKKWLWNTAAQGITAPTMVEAEKTFKATKVLASKGYVPITLFVENFIVVMATLLHDQHGVTEELFETLEELEQNKRHLNAIANDKIRFASQFIRTIQIQMNEYACSVEKGRRIKYPTFSTIVLVVLIDQLLPPPLPEKLEQQLFA